MNERMRKIKEYVNGFFLFLLVVGVMIVFFLVADVEKKGIDAEYKANINNAFNRGKEIGMKEVRMSAVSNGVAIWGADTVGNVEFKWKK